jgi:OmpA-OmpF porin, OOP family
MQRQNRVAILFALAAVALAAACSGGAQAVAKTEPAGVPDVDADGIPDDVDECVTEKEDGKLPKPKDGCKANPSDPDGDGLVASDKCPAQPETVNGYEDQDGCPDELPTETSVVVTVTKDELKCCAKVLFATGKTTIEAASTPLLEHLTKTFKDNPSIELVEVSGHADSQGNPQQNLTLTRQRAEAVVEALGKLGVDRKRLRAVGYGSYCPAVQGDTPETREINRRVEFKIVRKDGAETGAELGCAAAKAKGIGAPQASPPKGAAPTGGSI